MIDADILPVLEAGVITNGRSTPDDRLEWTYEQLLEVPGIGKKTAAKIIEAVR
jgi:predicted DNA-binding helix-hairpin-helix protein